MSGVFFQSLGLVALGAAAGGASRYALVAASVLLAPNFPYGTLTANLLGCFLAGLLIPFFPAMSPQLKSLAIAGFLGGLTTMSGFALDTTGLYRDSQTTISLLYWALGAIGSIVACAAGLFLSSSLLIDR